MVDMRHMDYLAGVAFQDVAELKRKEATYQGSWKRRGGVGAFMMLARKWDRLEQIAAANPERRYDIFWQIEKQPGDHDGTALAEVRDLRRYLLLVEAEMVARGVVPAPHLVDNTGDYIIHQSGETVTDFGGGVHETGRVSLVDTSEEAHTEGIRQGMRKAFPGYPGPGTPEDGGHHERQEDNGWLPYEFQGSGKKVVDTLGQDALHCYRMVHSTLYRLEDWVPAPRFGDPPPPFIKLADDNHIWWVLDRREFSPGTLVDSAGGLHRELNHKEWQEAQAWSRGMYRWQEEDSKWHLKQEYLAWAAEN